LLELELEDGAAEEEEVTEGGLVRILEVKVGSSEKGGTSDIGFSSV